MLTAQLSRPSKSNTACRRGLIAAGEILTRSACRGTASNPNQTSFDPEKNRTVIRDTQITLEPDELHARRGIAHRSGPATALQFKIVTIARLSCGDSGVMLLSKYAVTLPSAATKYLLKFQPGARC